MRHSFLIVIAFALCACNSTLSAAVNTTMDGGGSDSGGPRPDMGIDDDAGEPGNHHPTANAGASQTIHAPASSATLMGSGTDPDGDTLSFAWAQVGGTGATITNANTATTEVTGLAMGFNTFELTVTDGRGGSARAMTQVLVDSESGTSAGPGTNSSTGYSGEPDDYSDEPDARFRRGLTSYDTTALVAVPTFESMGLYWGRLTSVPSGNAVHVQYRAAGTSEWKPAMDMWFDARNNEYRSSVVGLTPGTAYEFTVSAESGTTAMAAMSTWSENFPIAETVVVAASSSSTLTIDRSGTPTGYILYTAAPGGSVIDQGFSPTGSSNCIDVEASYVIIRGLTLRNCQGDGVEVMRGFHDVVIEGNDMSGFGHGPGGAVMGETAHIVPGDFETGGVTCNGYNIEDPEEKPHRIIIQGNVFHDPRYGSIHWGYDHPNSANGISLNHCGGNNVIRYNEVRSTAGHYFMDGIGGSDNFTFEGFPVADSDIYGNRIGDCFDDGIEAEGGNRNIRIWGNYIHHTMVKIAMATTSIGPAYVFRNIGAESAGMYDPSVAPDDEDRGPFFKLGTREGDYINGGRIYLFHHTTIQPAIPSGVDAEYPFGTEGGIVNNGGETTNVVSRNNIWTNYKDHHAAIAIDGGNDVDYDLYNGGISVSGGSPETHGIMGYPTFAVNVDPMLEERNFTGSGEYVCTVAYVQTVDPSVVGNFQLVSSSDGYGAAVALPNFNDQYASPDIGAHQSGTPNMQFGPGVLGF